MKKAVFLFFALLLVPMAAHAGLFDFIVKVGAAFALAYTGNISWAAAIFTAAVSTYGEHESRRLKKNAQAQDKAQRDAYNASLKDRTITSVTTDAPWVFVYGRARVGSSVVAILPSGARDEFQHIIAIHAAHECDAIEEIYIGTKALGELSADGYAFNSPDYGSIITEYQNNTGVTSWTINENFVPGTVAVYEVDLANQTGQLNQIPFEQVGNSISVDRPPGIFRTAYSCRYSSVRVKKHLGVPGEAADATLIAECPGKWTTDSKLSGYCYTYIRLDLNQQEFQGGLPGIEALVRGRKLYDPRDDTSAWSQNAALVLYDYLRSPLCAVPSDDIPVADVIAAADVCDEVINVGSRYTFNGTVTSGQDQATLLPQMAQAMAGGLNSTTWEMWAGKWEEPVLTLEQADIVGSVAITPGQSDADIFNGVTGQFIGAENDYTATDIAPYQNAAYVAADGRELFESLDFPFTDESQRCWNLARIFLEDQRNSFTVQAEFSLKAWGVSVGDRITLNAPFFGFNSKVFRVVGKTYNYNSNVQLLLKEDAPEIWDEADAVVVDATPNTGLPNPFLLEPPASLSLSSGTNELLRQADGTVVSRIKATWPAGATIYSAQAELQIKRTEANDWQTAAIVDATLSVAYLSPVNDGVTYDVRIRFINPILTVQSSWRQAAPHTVVGKTAAPTAPTNVVVVGNQIYFTPNGGDADRAGYRLRNIPGTAVNWGAGQALHDGLAVVIPFTLPVRLFGVQTIMVLAVDTSGNESEVSATSSVTHDFGTATLDNVIKSQDYRADGFPGSYTDCSIDSGSLVADADPDDSIYSLTDLYSQADVYATNYLPMAWESQVFVPPYNGTLQVAAEFQGNAMVQYRIDGSTANDIYALDDVYAEADLYQDDPVWRTWPGALSVRRGEGIVFRVSIEGGSTRGAIDAFDAYFTMDSVIQRCGIKTLAAGGTRLSPVDGSPSYSRWLRITSVQITPVADGSGAAFGRIRDLNPMLGPLVELSNTDDVAVTGKATVDIGGIVDV